MEGAKQLKDFKETENVNEKSGFWSKIFKKDKFKKPQWVAGLYLRNNGRAEPMYLKANSDGEFVINGKKYHEKSDCKYVLGKDRIPFVIIEEDGLVPKGTREYYAKTIEQRCAEHQDLAIRAIRTAEIVKAEGQNKPMNNKTIIIIIIVAVVGLAILKNYV